MSDPISNMLVALKNGAMVSKDKVVIPFSNLKLAIAECLKDLGYITTANKKTEKNNINVIEMTLAYDANGPKIHDLTRVSKQSRRLYMGVKEIRPFKRGQGSYVFSTPKGILSDKQARKEQVGGEVLFKVW